MNWRSLDSRILFGFLLLVLLVVLAGVIALGKVEAATSEGLKEVIAGLLVLAGGWTQWAFREDKKNDREEDDRRM